MSNKVFFKTFGCRTNIYDTQVMIASLKDYELSLDENSADFIVINSCSVTNGADKAVKEYISKVKKLNKKIIFTGCGLEGLGKNSYENGVVYGAFGHSKKQDIANLLNKKERFYFSDDLNHVDDVIIDRVIGKSRGFIKIEEGCDFKCSYCIIPQVRGKSRSHKKEQILEQIRRLADSGISEVVLSGTNLGSYGKDTNDTLPKLLIDISKISGIKRIRLGSLEPSQIKEDFLELLDSSFLEKHLHIALQHTSNDMLKVMNRINRFENDYILFDKIAKKGFAIGTDFIVGHPFEKDEVFNEAFSNLKILPLTHIHSFIYSPRSNTPSSKMKIDVPKVLAKERLKLIRDLIESKNLDFRKNKGELEVLVENKKRDYFYGLDQFFNKICIKSDKNLSLKWVRINDYKVNKDMNYAEI
ncbi:tRNA (N(6)-L-threonylcarbamoyladenosine(37)-C(2))-methylthiotransferase MtaB [Helicobacter sp. MIT 14-3879]|uniref:tRNA (N(6)-L-threonylcarbamoyladenosine(37)-C(2))- methylthiotransferase MtaB n=1 Tax=Helicobacter sp. MIT 14-3879 TaxID=2040649 RepID=UPI000E1F297F|nr:tRNA (N(6)-L-threonylcarbamoyladenosine(37)-C(2))-methylthiotransferase MtaB [Helicobacter sp. MIT 14-3879]RDU62436.1 tRNA (N(6)-L-threonylcarbamoyladenosine(37)-C(2))-methylthiotransferase MtaB [Helicobacter sp. MIT 14-3879]